MLTSIRSVLVFFGSCALVACGAGVDASGADAAIEAAPSCPVDETAPACPTMMPDVAVPTGCRMFPMTFDSCQPGGNAITVFGADDSCAADVTVLFSWAPWCGYCTGMAAAVHDAVVAKYGARVRVIGTISEDDVGGVPTTATCTEFGNFANLTGVTLSLDPRRQVPNQLIREQTVVDKKGRLRALFYRDTTHADQYDVYIASNMANVIAAIDDVLAHPDP